MKILMLNKFGLFVLLLRKFGFFIIAVVKIFYWSILWMTKFVLKSSWYSFATYNLSFTNRYSRSFQLLSWKLLITSISISHDVSFMPMMIFQNHLSTFFNVLKDIFEQCQMCIPKNGFVKVSRQWSLQVHCHHVYQ